MSSFFPFCARCVAPILTLARMYEEDYSDGSMDVMTDFDGDDFLVDDIEEVVDVFEFEELAKKKLIFHLTCTVGSVCAAANILRSEAELFLNRSDFRAALISAIASDLAAGSPSNTRKAIETICLYQLGDRNAALRLSQDVEAGNLSGHLKDRFVNTVEVLQFMPQLLQMLRQPVNLS